MGSRSRRKATVKELPPEIVLFNILPRLPAKSVLRFKTVSKQWNSFITNPMFSKMHLQHHNNYKLLFISTETPYKFCTIECEAPDNGLTPTRSLPFQAENMPILTSFDGLVCVGIKKAWYDTEYSDIILWNPLTGDCKTLSKANLHMECYKTSETAFGLYYSSSEDDYKLLHVTHSCHVYIYSLKSDSWRKIKSTQDFHHLSYWFSDHWMPSTSLNEKLYFLKEVKTIYPHTYSITILDLKTEKLTEIPTPFIRNFPSTCLRFTVLKGCIYIWMQNILPLPPKIELWRMDEDGDKEWTNVVTYCATISFPVTWLLNPLHLITNGNWLMHSEGYLCKVDPHNPSTILCSYTVKFMDIVGECI